MTDPRTLMFEALVAFGREALDLAAIRLRTSSYLVMADAFGADDPRATPRIVPRPVFAASWMKPLTPDDAHALGMRMVRVGASFEIRGPCGPVTIEEEKP